MLLTSWRVFRNGLLRAFAYRTTIGFWMLSRVTQFFLATSLWSAIFASTAAPTIGGYDRAGMIAYYLLAFTVLATAMSYNEYTIAPQIRSGSIAAYLTRPFDYALMKSIESISWHVLQGVIAVAIFWICGRLVGVPFGTGLRLYELPAFLLSIVFAVVISNAISVLMASLTFWTPETNAFFDTKGVLFFILGGAALPLSILPGAFRTVVERSFLPTIVAIPLWIADGTHGAAAPLLAQQAAWTLVFLLLAAYAWRRGIRRFESVGG